MTLRSRIAALVAVTVLLASAIAGFGVALSSRNVGIDRLDDALRADAVLLGDRPAFDGELQRAFELRQAACGDDIEELTDIDGPPPGNPPRALSREERRFRVLGEFSSEVQLVRPNGNVFTACLLLPISDNEVVIAAQGAGIDLRTVTIDDDRYRLLTRGYGQLGAVQFARPLDLTEDTMRGLVTRIIGFGVFGAVLAGAAGWFLARRATGPVKRLSAAAERVASTGNLGERLDVTGRDELADLATSFNTMLESLDTSRAQQRRLVQDASHELRTPLTSIRTNIELLQRHRDIDDAVRASMLDDISSELVELSELTTELVDSATEVSTDPTKAVRFDLAAVVQQCVERGRRRHRREISLAVEPPRDTGQPNTGNTNPASPDASDPTRQTATDDAHTVVGDASLVARAVTNLINNAVKFTTADTPIEVHCDRTTVRVVDEGPGVPPDDLANIFDRFYRTDTARQAPGSGLGLAIVKQVVEQHGGTVRAQNRVEGGLDIGFHLPASS